MLNLSRILEEARNSSVTYPNVYRTNKVWKIREDNHSPWGRPMNSYLLASFVLKNHLKVLELGFNVRSNSITGDRTLMFLTKEDAESFLTFLKRNYVSDIDWNGYIIAGGRCDEDMVRITSDEFGIPVYVYKRSIEYLLKFKDSDLKIPSYVVDRLSDQAIVSKEQQDKEFKKQTLKGKVDEQNERLFNILKSIDPNLKCNRGGNNNSIGYIIINVYNVKVEFSSGAAGSKNGELNLNFIEFPDRITCDRSDLTEFLKNNLGDTFMSGNKVSLCVYDMFGRPILTYLSERPRIDFRKSDQDIKNLILSYIKKITDIVYKFADTEEFI